ncbi:MAG: molybdopterin-dependent oxidoreductase [Deltaproteobacteria bacterium]|nr:molybdopterin-dependent oxidoreductase [Deltaproteobacteria bacterium]
MTEWKKTSCVLCAQNCGLEVQTDGGRITRVRPDKANPRSKGYVCRKGQHIAHFQNHAQRLTNPLKKVGSDFEVISWERAVFEITERLKTILPKHGPRSLAYMGGGGQGCHFDAAFGRSLLKSLGSSYHYNATAQELTGYFWVCGRVLGKQYLSLIPDEHNTDMLVAIGWNGWMSHQMPQARRRLKEISKDPDRLLVVIDPRRSETAELADIHLPIRCGTDALFTRAVISIILQEGWENKEYIEAHVSGFDEVKPLFEGFDARAAIGVCGLKYDDVREFARLFATRKSSLHADLGTLMNRHSTVASYLQAVLMAVCGRIGVSGGNVIPGTVMPLGSHSDERKSKTWRTTATGFPEIMGYFPPNVMPEEIMSGRDDRLRAVIVSGSNPLRSYADTHAYEQAFAQLDLLVTIDVSMSETARLSHYVLPARSGYEKYDSTFFAWSFPEVFFQMRRPLAEPRGESLEESEIFTRLAEGMGILPEIPDDLKTAAKGDRQAFVLKLMGFVGEHPEVAGAVPFILARTLGPVLGSGNLAAFWGLLQGATSSFRENAARAGFKQGPNLGEEVFRAVMEHPEGIWIGKQDPENNLALLRTEDRKINLAVPELYDWIKKINAEQEQRALVTSGDYPLILMAGRHMDMNANTLMRDPSWNQGRRACTLAMHPRDAEALGMKDGQMARVETAAGSAEVELEITDSASLGHVVIPHGFGLAYAGKTYGINVNRLTKNTNRDRLAATPLHRFVPCRVKPF